MWNRRLLLVAVVSSLCFVGVMADTIDAYQRIDPLEMRVGIAVISRAAGAFLPVPTLCPDGPASCQTEVRFQALYRIDFQEEHWSADALPFGAETVDRGSVFLAFTADSETEQAFENRLQQELAQLAARRFSEAFAGLTGGHDPFNVNVPENQTDNTAWACFDNDGSRILFKFDREVKKERDGSVKLVGSGTSAYADEEYLAPFCDAVSGGPAFAPVQTIRTAPSLIQLKETRILVETRNMLRADSRLEELLARPRGVRLTTMPNPGVLSGGSQRTSSDGCLVEAEQTTDGIAVSATAKATDLPPAIVSMNGWVSRWTTTTLKRELGPSPSNHSLGEEVLYVALLPTTPPEPLDERGKKIDEIQPKNFLVELNEDDLIAAVSEKLAGESILNNQALESALTLEPKGLGPTGWVMVICRTDGSAEFFLPPTSAHCHVKNADAFCAAIERAAP